MEPSNPAFTISVGTFSGPLDVLLDLVEKRKLFINEVSLASVADAFVAYVQEHKLSLYERAAFIAVAATLILIKSRSLLPDFHLTDDEEAQVNDLTEALERYAIYKKATKNLDKTWGVAYLAPFRKELKLPVYFVPTQDLTVGDISQALTKMVTSLPALAPSYPKAKVQKTISIEDMIERLRARVLSGVQTSFRDSASNSHRGDVIVLFLALLELVKLGAIDAEQSEQHDDIIIRAAQPQEQVV